jgi:hypothetical protein
MSEFMELIKLIGGVVIWVLDATLNCCSKATNLLLDLLCAALFAVSVLPPWRLYGLLTGARVFGSADFRYMAVLSFAQTVVDFFVLPPACLALLSGTRTAFALHALTRPQDGPHGGGGKGCFDFTRRIELLQHGADAVKDLLALLGACLALAIPTTAWGVVAGTGKLQIAFWRGRLSKEGRLKNAETLLNKLHEWCAPERPDTQAPPLVFSPL